MDSAAGGDKALHYLDEFLVVGDQGRMADESVQSALDCYGKLGIPIAAHKTKGPVTRITFLGIDMAQCQNHYRQARPVSL